MSWASISLPRTATPLYVSFGRPPLSVSSDRIAVPAWRCAPLLTAAHGDGAVERHGGRIAEAYPGGALSLWGFERRG